MSALVSLFSLLGFVQTQKAGGARGMVTCWRRVLFGVARGTDWRSSRGLMLLQQDFSFLCSQSCGIAVADNVPLVAGVAPLELKGSSLQEVVRRLLDGC